MVITTISEMFVKNIILSFWGPYIKLVVSVEDCIFVYLNKLNILKTIQQKYYRIK